MNKLGHLVLGAFLGIIFIIATHFYFSWFDFLDYKFYLIALIIIPLYSLLPDIDHESGTITWFFLGIAIFGCIVGIFTKMIILYFSIALLVMTFLAVKLFHHRGIIHTVWVGALVAIPLIFIFDYQIAILGFIAFYSHLLGDGLPFKIT